LLSEEKFSSYFLYGINIRSEWQLPCLPPSSSAPFSINVSNGHWAGPQNTTLDFFRSQSIRKFHLHKLEDGCSFFIWRNLFEFLVSPDSLSIKGRKLDPELPVEALQAYMLGHVLSFCLTDQGIEALHATTVSLNGNGVGFMGEGGYGKSSLGGAFLQAGHKLVCDDQLVLNSQNDALLASPGLPRIKLYEKMSKIFLGNKIQGVPFNRDHSPKMIFTLPFESRSGAVPLRALYILASPAAVTTAKDVRIEPLSKREAFVELTRNSYNAMNRTPERIARQFEWATMVADRIPTRRLSYPRLPTMFPGVLDAVAEDIASLV
jgi:hypothetical protein